MLNISKVVKLSEKFPNNKLKASTCEENFSSPFLLDQDGDDFNTEIQSIREFRELFTLISTQCSTHNTLKTAVKRGAALVAPYLLPKGEKYSQQNQQALNKLNQRYISALNCQDEMGPLSPEVYTLIAMGPEFCKFTSGTTQGYVSAFPEIEKHLTVAERELLINLHIANKQGVIDGEFEHSHVMFYHMLENLSDIKQGLLVGDIDSADVSSQGQMIADVLSEYEMPAVADMVEHEICQLLRDIETLKTITPVEHDHELYQIFKQGKFDPDHLDVTVQELGIPDSPLNLKIIYTILEQLDLSPLSSTKQGFEIFKHNTLSPLLTFLDYYPDADPLVVTYALAEDFLLYDECDEYEDEAKLNIGDVLMSTIVHNATPEEAKKLIAYKQASIVEGDFQRECPELAQELQAFHTCKKLVQIYQVNRHLELSAYKNLLIHEDIEEAEKLITEGRPRFFENADLIEEVVNNIEQLKLNIENAYEYPPLTIEEQDELETIKQDQSGTHEELADIDVEGAVQKTRHLRLVTKDWTPE